MDKLFCNRLLGITAICLIVGIISTDGSPRVFRTNEICRYNAQRIYLDLGESGKISAHNVSVSNDMFDINLRFNKSLAMECSLELVTCPSCIIKLTLEHSSFPSQCSPQRDGPCKCDHLVFSEPPYDSVANLKYSCGNDLTIRSKTRSLQIKFIHWNNISHAFSLNYVSERNRDTITANPGDITNEIGNHNQIMSSPFFPAIYPRDFSVEHLLTCMVESCRIHILFTDFQVAKSSTMEFFDSDGERIDVVSGASFRPPVILSKGPSLSVRFYANGNANGLGYRAKITFLNMKSAKSPMLKPFTNCGGMVERVGGAITMMKMLENEKEKRLYDCIWLIIPSSGFLHYKSHLSLRVDAFEKLEPGSRLVIKQGSTSDRPILEEMLSPTTATSSKGFVVPLVSGFYVSFRGTFNFDSRLAIIHTAFSYMNCYIGSEFLCKNHRCIPIQLHCDGFDSCGDKSDEPESCLAEWKTEPIDRKWYSHTPNFYFPKVNQYPDLRAATTVFIGSSFGLLFLISTLLFLLYRTGSRARDQRELQSHLQTISELLDNTTNHGNHNPPDLPPLYDQVNCDLPSYDEVIKIGMEGQMKNNIRRSDRKYRHHKRRRSSAASYDVNTLQVMLPPENIDLPSTSSAHVGGTNDNASVVDPINFLPSMLALDFSRGSIEECTEETAEQTESIPNYTEIGNRSVLQNSHSESDEHVQLNESFLSASPFTSTSNTNQDTCLWKNSYRRTWVKFSPFESNSEPSMAIPTLNSLALYQMNKPNMFSNSIKSLNTSHHIFRRSSTFECSPTEFANRIECSECKNLLVFKKESSICSNCICKLYSPKTCISCNGRISFQDLTQVKNLETLHGNQFNRKLCNCLARIQSPTFDSIQSKDMHSSSEITDHFLDPGAYYSLAGTSNSYFMSIDDFSDDVI